MSGSIGLGAVQGPELVGTTAVSANYTVQLGDNYVEVTTGTSNITVTLPKPVTAGSQPGDAGIVNSAGSVGNQGQKVTITKVDSAGNGTTTGTVDIKGTFISAASGHYSLKSQYSALTFLSDGTTWYVIGQVS